MICFLLLFGDFSCVCSCTSYTYIAYSSRKHLNTIHIMLRRSHSKPHLIHNVTIFSFGSFSNFQFLVMDTWLFMLPGFSIHLSIRLAIPQFRCDFSGNRLFFTLPCPLPNCPWYGNCFPTVKYTSITINCKRILLTNAKKKEDARLKKKHHLGRSSEVKEMRS